jgi:hypothetical protein
MPVLTPKVSEIPQQSAHEREAERVRRSLLAVPDAAEALRERDPSDPLRRLLGRRSAAAGTP